MRSLLPVTGRGAVPALPAGKAVETRPSPTPGWPYDPTPGVRMVDDSGLRCGHRSLVFRFPVLLPPSGLCGFPRCTNSGLWESVSSPTCCHSQGNLVSPFSSESVSGFLSLNWTLSGGSRRVGFRWYKQGTGSGVQSRVDSLKSATTTQGPAGPVVDSSLG